MSPLCLPVASPPAPAGPAVPEAARPAPSGDSGLAMPAHRRADLQAFATLLTQVYRIPCHVVWHSHDARQHRLYAWTTAEGWQCHVGTEADLAHQLHVLGATWRAAQRRQHHRQPSEGQP